MDTSNANNVNAEYGNILDESIPILPSQKLWEPDQTVPDELAQRWPVEETLATGLAAYYPDGVPEGINLSHARGIANYMRQIMWKQYKSRGQKYLEELAAGPGR